jgi:hypothetical protein
MSTFDKNSTFGCRVNVNFWEWIKFGLTLAGRQISGYVKFYEQLKSGGYAKEADFLLNTIKKY